MDIPVAIATDHAGSVYVTGGRRPTVGTIGTQQNFVHTVKYNPRGRVRWDDQQELDFGTAASLRFSMATPREVIVVRDGVELDMDANPKLLLRTEFHYQPQR